MSGDLSESDNRGESADSGYCGDSDYSGETGDSDESGESGKSCRLVTSNMSQKAYMLIHINMKILYSG